MTTLLLVTSSTPPDAIERDVRDSVVGLFVVVGVIIAVAPLATDNFVTLIVPPTLGPKVRVPPSTLTVTGNPNGPAKFRTPDCVLVIDRPVTPVPLMENVSVTGLESSFWTWLTMILPPLLLTVTGPREFTLTSRFNVLYARSE